MQPSPFALFDPRAIAAERGSEAIVPQYSPSERARDIAVALAVARKAVVDTMTLRAKFVENRIEREHARALRKEATSS